MSTPDTSVLVAALNADLEEWGPLNESTGEPMAERGLVLWSEDGREAGAWEVTAGTAYFVQEDHEFVHILTGRVTVTPDGGKPTHLGPGDCAMFPRGWAGTWQVHETLRKLFVVF